MSDEYIKTAECKINLNYHDFFKCFLTKKVLYSRRLHLCDTKYSTNSNTVKYYCNWKYLFSISI